MDEKERDNVAVFDTLFTNNQIQIMKVLLPYFDRPMQKYLAIYIKYQELQYTLSYFRNHPYHICSSSEDSNAQFRKLLPALLPYCSDSQKRIVQQIEQVFSSLETYQEMMDMMELMKDMDLTAPGSECEGSDGEASAQAAADTPDNEAGPQTAANAPDSEAGPQAAANAPDSETGPQAAANAPDSETGASASNMDMLLSLLSPQQQGIFDLIKGGIKHE